MGFSGVGANSQDAGGIANLADRVSHRSAAERGDQTGHRGGMSETGTVVNVVLTEYYPSEFLDGIVVLVGALG